jgi:hypothetical protein
VQAVLRFVAAQLGDSVDQIVKTYLNGGYADDDAAAFDGAVIAMPRAASGRRRREATCAP